MGASPCACAVRWEGQGTWGTRTRPQVLPYTLMGYVVFGKLSTFPKPQLPLPVGCRPCRKFYLAHERYSVDSGHHFYYGSGWSDAILQNTIKPAIVLPLHKAL